VSELTEPQLRAKLTDPQWQMLSRAAKDRRGEVFIRRGQAKTASRLAHLGLVTTYYPNAHTHKAVVTDRGREVLADA
jgi:hypothetical protein